MHIAFLNPQGNFDPHDKYWSQHPDFGGQLVYVKEVAVAMAALGHQVDIITRQIIDPEWPEFATPLDYYPSVPGLRILRIPCGPMNFLPKEALWPYLGTEWVPNLIGFYQNKGAFPDVITTHYGDSGLCGAIINEKVGIPYTFTAHSLGAQKMEKMGITLKNLAKLDSKFHFARRIFAERVSMNHAGRIITSTNQERMEQYAHFAYRGAVETKNETRFAVVPPGVNLEIFSPDPGAEDEKIGQRILSALARDITQERRGFPLIVSSSRLDPKKNHIGLVKAFAQDATLQSSANLAIVVRGLDDPFRDYASLIVDEKNILQEITKAFDEYGLWGKVTAFPLNSQVELAAAYRFLTRRCSVFSLTSLYEPFGLAPLEAMSCGLPAVVTRNGGPSESLQEGGQMFGVLIDPGDPEDIARGLLWVTNSPESWQHFHQAGMQRVLNRYTWSRTAEGYLSVLKELRRSPDSPGNISIPPYFTHPSPENEIKIEELAAQYFPVVPANRFANSA